MVKKILKLWLFMNIISFISYAGQIKVITTLFPTYDFVRQIGKDKVDVSLFLPPGVEPHTFEPKPKDILKLNRADIFIYTGKYMEPWVEDLLKSISNKNLLVIDASYGIELISSEEEDVHHEDEHINHHYHSEVDPHIWLDLENAQIMVDNIATALVKKDPVNREFYLNNAQDYKLKLIELDNLFKDIFSQAKHRTIIYAGHFAFGYFAKRYGLKHISPYQGFSPNAEPSPKAIGELIKFIKGSGQKYIYYEELIEPKVAKILSQETGVKLELLHAAHNVSRSELNRGVTFIEIMKANLEKLKVGLECQ
ncbi:MAG: zinc ABC transporter substrate-binding protein [Candidatus Omnitrophica bacterium]|nr:zinc ABC transporter substrate-binding protein [Candidatus Omnitrophota bacterium]MCM8826946.1 zinc ABC transporter substrate-binding protein [Candidatus Omnitrophota bacterium]